MGHAAPSCHGWLAELRDRGRRLLGAADGRARRGVRGQAERGPRDGQRGDDLADTSRTGAATAASPSSSSSTAVTNPRARTVPARPRAGARSVMVRGANDSSSPGGRCAAPHARNTLPNALAWSGTPRPDPVVVPSKWRVSIWAIVSRPSGPDGEVDGLAGGPRGAAARLGQRQDVVAERCRAARTAAARGRAAGRRGVPARCSSPARSSEAISRLAVHLGSPVTPPARRRRAARGDSTTRTSSWAARSMRLGSGRGDHPDAISWNSCSTHGS